MAENAAYQNRYVYPTETEITNLGTHALVRADVWLVAPDATEANAEDVYAEDDFDEEAPVTDITRKYLDDIGREPLLTAEQEVEHAKSIEAGLYAAHKLRQGAGLWALSPKREQGLQQLVEYGEDSKRQMLLSNLRLVVMEAKKRKYRHRAKSMTMLDLIQEGNLGVAHAVEKFDYTKGYKFSTYAMWWIKQYINRAIASQDRVISIPVHTVEKIDKLRNESRAFERQHGRDPTKEELAAAAEFSLAKVEDLLAVSRDIDSLDRPVRARQQYGSTDNNFGETIEDANTPAPEDIATFTMLRQSITAALSHMEEREKWVLQRRYGLNDGKCWEMPDIAARLGLPPHLVQRIEDRALTKLRHPSMAGRLQAYTAD